MADNLPLRCRLHWHHWVDFPDPNPESGGLEKQGYRACTHCPKEKDARTFLNTSGFRLLAANHPDRLDGHPLP